MCEIVELLYIIYLVNFSPSIYGAQIRGFMLDLLEQYANPSFNLMDRDDSGNRPR